VIVPLNHILLLSALLFTLGMFCTLARRNLIMMLLGIEIMLNAAAVGLCGRGPALAADGRAGHRHLYPGGRRHRSVRSAWQPSWWYTGAPIRSTRTSNAALWEEGGSR
jgi:hypothetical protein